MTRETMQAVVTELKERGIEGTLEYPGSIFVVYVDSETDTRTLVCGDVNENFCCDLCDKDLSACDSVESSIPSDSDDVKAIADFVASTYTEAVEGHQAGRA
jgi:hypothetical protein